jgi:hypothetical protein
MTLDELIANWEHHARRKWYDAEREKNPMGKKLIEHGAICYQNCARELSEALILVSPVPSATQVKGQK